MLKPSKTRILGGYSKNPTLPLTRTDSYVKATKGADSKQSEGNTGNAGIDSPDDNIITARLRQEGILPPLPPIDRTGTSDSVTPNKITSQTSTPASASSGTITLPSKLKLNLFRQYIADVYAGQSDSAASSGTIPKSGVLTPTPQNPLLGTKQSDPKASRIVSKTSDGSILTQTPEIAQLSELIAKLPSGFPIAEWDNMTSQQRLIAVRSSGLSPQEQWKLLNASGALSTIAAIQDIQGNSRAYGLTPEKADTISAGLLKIDSARTSVKNGGMPFATEMQRGLFLSQLDKEEQKLLDSVDGQESSGRDIIFKNDRRLDSDQPIFEPKPKVVNNVDSESKLGRTAKNILKFYLNARFLNQANDFMSNLEYFGDIIDKGTISVGVSGNASLVFTGGINGSVGLVMDSQGDVGVITSYGGYGGIPSASAVFFASISNADDILNLAGESFEGGGSVSLTPTAIAPVIGGETSIFTNVETGKTYFSLSLNGGVAVGFPSLPVEGHFGLTTSQVTEMFNLFEEWSRFMEEYKQW